MEIPDGDLFPQGMGKKYPLQAFMGILTGKFFRRGDRFKELKSDREFRVVIPTRKDKSTGGEMTCGGEA